jgi:hypothetical protein
LGHRPYGLQNQNIYYPSPEYFSPFPESFLTHFKTVQITPGVLSGKAWQWFLPGYLSGCSVLFPRAQADLEQKQARLPLHSQGELVHFLATWLSLAF